MNRARHEASKKSCSLALAILQDAVCLLKTTADITNETAVIQGKRTVIQSSHCRFCMLGAGEGQNPAQISVAIQMHMLSASSACYICMI